MDDDDDIELDEYEDLPPLTQAAVALHEMYIALVDAGFGEGEALRMIAWLIADTGIEE